MILNIKIIISNNNHIINSQLCKALKSLNGRQNYFYYEVKNDIDNYVFTSSIINWNYFYNSVDITKYINSYYIYITDKPFSDNWFSHETEHISVITTNSWNEMYSPPSLKAYLIYQIVQSTVNFEVELSENTELKKMVHESSIGCLFDFCSHKPDLKIGMMSGVICPDCESKLLRYGIDRNAINAINNILNDVRLETLGRTVPFNDKDAFVVMHFTSNDENDHAYQYGIRTALKELGINCRRADDYVQPRTLLTQIKNFITQSRFVIAKVDSQNLNVYFELGLAMGLNKDVLLISEENLIINLPTDLNNWECLTYSKGNYDELKNKIISFYKNNYHY